MEDLIHIFKEIRDVPYEVPLEFSLDCNNCAGKVLKLKKRFEEMGYECRYVLCSFRWGDLDIPNEILHLLEDDLSTHVYLEVLIDEKWLKVDASWDSGLQSRFDISEWDGINDTIIAVKAIDTYSNEESEKVMNNLNKEDFDKEMQKNGEFYKAFNNWLELIRKNAA